MPRLARISLAAGALLLAGCTGSTPLSPTEAGTSVIDAKHDAPPGGWQLPAYGQPGAKLPHIERGAWHAFRRKWATERKHLPTVDVAAAGGWAGAETLMRCYQHPDDATMLAVVLGAGQLRERRG